MIETRSDSGSDAGCGGTAATATATTGAWPNMLNDVCRKSYIADFLLNAITAP